MSNQQHFASLYLRALLKEMFGGEPTGWTVPVDVLLKDHLWSNSLIQDGWNAVHKRGEGIIDVVTPNVSVNAIIGVTSIARVSDCHFTKSARTLAAAFGAGGDSGLSQHIFLNTDPSVDPTAGNVFTLNGASIDAGVVVFCDPNGKSVTDESVFIKEPHKYPYEPGYISPEKALKNQYLEELKNGIPTCPYYEWGISLSNRHLKEAAINTPQWDEWRSELAAECDRMGYGNGEYFQTLILGAVTQIKVTSGSSGTKKGAVITGDDGKSYDCPLLSYTVPVWTMWVRAINRAHKLQESGEFKAYKSQQASRVKALFKNVNANIALTIAAEEAAPAYVKAMVEENKEVVSNPPTPSAPPAPSPQKPTIANADLKSSGAPVPLNVVEENGNSLLQRQAEQRKPNGAKPPVAKKGVTNLTLSTPPTTPSVVTTPQAPPSLTKPGLEGSAPPRRTEEKSVEPEPVTQLNTIDRVIAECEAIAKAKREAAAAVHPAPTLEDGEADGSLNWD